MIGRMSLKSSPGAKRAGAVSVACLCSAALAIVFCAAPVAPARQRNQSGAPAQSQANQPAAPKSSSALVSPDEDYRIGAGDVIEVQIEDASELSRSYRVTAAGTFLMSFVGRLKAKDKTPDELAQEIADRLRGDYLKDPQVTVVVKEYNSRSFFIQGAVHSPGVFQIEGRPSLLTLVTLAGGLNKDHGAQAYVIRKAKSKASPGEQSQAQAVPVADAKAAAAADEDEAEYDLIKVNINSLLRGNFSNNAVLEPGDIVNIPQADVFYVAGEVNAPGPFPLKEGTTIRQAISLAQGTNYKAATDKCVIFRDDPEGRREEIKVDVNAIMKGKKDDITIMANDIIVVPNSRMKSIGGALLRSFGMSTVSRVPIP